MPDTPALVRPNPFSGDFGPFATAERRGRSPAVMLAIERFAAQPDGVVVANPALRICRHLDTPLRFASRPQGWRAGEAFIAPGQHFVFGGGAAAHFLWQAPFRTLSLTIADDLLRSLPAAPASSVAIRADDPVLERLTALALLEAEEGFPRGELFAEGLGLAAAAHVARCPSAGLTPPQGGQRNGLGPRRLAALREAVEAALPGRPTLLELAEAIGYPPHRLGPAFRRSTGITLWAYAAERRLALAEGLLRDPDLSLAAVAARAGYSSQAHMTTTFRTRRGVTPSAWRKLLQG